MKTPRDILLQKHQGATPRLERVWSEVASSAFDKPESPTTRLFFVSAWHELFWSYRRAWSGFAAVWAMLLVIHLSHNNSSGFTRLMAGIPSGESMAALQQEQEFLAALTPVLTMHAHAKDAPPPSLPPRKDTTSDLFRRENDAVA